MTYFPAPARYRRPDLTSRSVARRSSRAIGGGPSPAPRAAAHPTYPFASLDVLYAAALNAALESSAGPAPPDGPGQRLAGVGKPWLDTRSGTLRLFDGTGDPANPDNPGWVAVGRLDPARGWVAVDPLPPAAGRAGEVMGFDDTGAATSGGSFDQLLALLANPPPPDAPEDGTVYGRQDGAWAPAPTAAIGTDAPSDGLAYARQARAWTQALPATPRASAAMGFNAGGAPISGGNFPNLVNLTRTAPAGIATIPFWAVGMDTALADNATALASGLTNFNGIIDGGHQTFKFTQAGGTDTTPGPLNLAAASGVRGLRNMTLDFSACLADRYCLYPKGYSPGQPQALMADLAADADPTIITVASATNFSIGQPVLLRSGAVWCSNGFGTTPIGSILPWHLTEFNRVIGIAGNQLTLEAPTANDFLVSDQAYVAPLNSTPTGGWAPLAFHLDNVTIIGAGAARTADVQYGLRLLYAQGSRIKASFRDCWDTSCQAQVCVDTTVDYIKASDSGGLGRGYCFVSAGCWRTQVVTAVAENCNQVVDTSGTQLSFGSGLFRVLEEEEWGRPPLGAEALAGAVQFDCIDRGTHVNSIMTSGDYHAGAAFNSHPPAAQTWVDSIMGKSKLAGSDGQFVYMGGYQQGFGTLIAPYSAGVACLFQYAGGRDKYGPAWYRAGSINLGGVGPTGHPLLVQGLSYDATRPLDFVDVKSIATGADCRRGVRLDSSAGPIGMVNIGASVIAAADPNYSGVELLCSAGGYSLGRLRIADSYISTTGSTRSAVYASTAGVTIPEINLTNCTLGGGAYGLTGASARFSLTGQVKIQNAATAPYSMDALSYVEIFGGAPADRWAPTGSGSYQLKASKTEVAPTAAGATHTFLLPVGFYAGQEFAVAMLANGDAGAVWTPASGQSISGMPTSLAAFSAVRARFDGVSAWVRIGSEVAAAIPAGTPGAVLGFDATGAPVSSAALTAGRLVKGGGTTPPVASAWWNEDANFNLAVNYAGVGSTSSRGLAITANDAAASAVSGTAFGASGLLLSGTRYGGTSAARALTEANIAMLAINALGYDGTTTPTRAAIQFYSAETWTPTANGTRLRFFSTPLGGTTLTQGAQLQPDGTWYVGSVNTATTVNTGSGTVNVATDYYRQNVKLGLAAMGDVTIAAPAAGDFLTWNGAASKWGNTSYPSLLNLTRPPPATASSPLGLPTIPAWACGMDASLADNSLQLAAGLANFQGVIDGGGLTYKLTQGAGVNGSGPLSLSNLTGLKGLTNMTIDASACVGDQAIIEIFGRAPTTPLTLTADAIGPTQTLAVASTASLKVGQYVILNSQATWCTGVQPPPAPGGILITTNEYNRVLALGPGTITLQNPTKNDYRMADSAVVIGVNPDGAGGVAPLQFVTKGLTIIGAGPARTAAAQYGMRLYYSLASSIDAEFRQCADYGFAAGVNIDLAIPRLIARDCHSSTGLGYGLVLVGGWRTQIGQVTADNCDQAVSVSSTALTFGGVSFGMIDRNCHVDSIQCSGDFHVGGAINSHPGAAGLWVDSVLGDTQWGDAPSGDGSLCVLQGFQQGIGHVSGGAVGGVPVALKYSGGRDKYGLAWYRVASIDAASSAEGAPASTQRQLLLIQGLSADPGRALDLVSIGGLSGGAAVGEGVYIDSTGGPIGLVDLGPAHITTDDPVSGRGLFVTSNSGGYPTDRVIWRSPHLVTPYNAGAPTSRRPIHVSLAAGIAFPTVILDNAELIGGDYAISVTNGVVILCGRTICSGFNTGEYSIAAGSQVLLDGPAPHQSAAPSGSTTIVMNVSRLHITPVAAGYSLTIQIPPLLFKGQIIEVAMIGQSANTVWTSADSAAIHGAPASMPAYSSVRLSASGTPGALFWNWVGAAVGAAAIPAGTPGAVLGYDASGAPAASAALTAGNLVKGGGTTPPVASSWWREDGSFNLAVNYAGVGTTATKGLFITGNDGAAPGFTGVGFGAPGALLSGTRYGGTSAARTPTEANISMLNLNALGYDGAAVQTRATIQYYSSELWTATANGTRIRFSTTPIGGTALTQGAVLQADGTWYVGINGSSTAVNTGAGTVNVATDYYRQNVRLGLAAMGDVTITTPAGNDFLTWSSATSRWVNTAAASVAGLAGAVTHTAGALTAQTLTLGNGAADAKASAIWSQDASTGNLTGNFITSGAPAGSSADALYIVGADTAAPSVVLEAYNGPPQLIARRTGGTAAAPAAIADDVTILALTGAGFDTALTGARAQVGINAAETWAAGANGTKLKFFTTGRGSTTLTFRGGVEADGTLYIGSNSSSSAVNTGAGTVNAATGYYLNNKNVTPGSLQVAQATPANPVGTASTTGVMMGLAAAITPQATSRVQITISGDIFNANAVGNGATARIRWGTGTAPVNGAALVGTAVGGNVQFIAATTAQKSPFSLSAIVSGLTAGTAYWIDLAVAALVAGTATVENLSVSIFEL